MRTIYLLFAFVFYFCFTILCDNCYGQNDAKLDSLLHQLTTCKEDTNKATLLFKIRDLLFYNDMTESNSYNAKGLALSQKLHFAHGIITGYSFVSSSYLGKGDFKNSLYYHNTLLTLKPHNSLDYFYDYNGYYTGYYRSKGDYAKAMDYSNKAIQAAYATNDTNYIINSLEERAAIYRDISNYPAAINYLLESVKLDQGKNDILSKSANFYRLALVYDLNHDSINSVNYLSKAYKIAKETNSRLLIFNDEMLMGNIYMNEKKWDKALNYFQQALTINTSFRDSGCIGVVTTDIATIYNEMGQYDKALHYISISIETESTIKNELELSTSYECMGKIYMKEKKFPLAIAYLHKGLNVADSTGQKNNQCTICQEMAKCYEALNDYKSAYVYSTEFGNLKNSIFNDEALKKTVEMDAVYTSDKKDKEIALLSKDKKIEELEKYSFMAGMLLICILFFFIYRNYKIHQSYKLQQLRNKIALDLHDEIGPTLSSIKIVSEVARNNSKESTPAFDRIINFSQETIESFADIVWTINPENDNFEKIIIRMRSFAYELLGAKNILFEFNVSDSLDDLKLSMDERKNLYLIFKEAINNMIKHSEANRAEFSISNTNNELTLLIKDNGKGFNIDQLTQGNGLESMKKRASQIGAGFSIESQPGNGTIIQLSINTAA